MYSKTFYALLHIFYAFIHIFIFSCIFHTFRFHPLCASSRLEQILLLPSLFFASDNECLTFFHMR